MQIFKIIRGNGKKYFDRIRNERLKQNLLQAIPFWIASLIAGLIAVFYTKIFALSEQLSLYIFHRADWTIFISAPVCFAIAWIVVIKFSPYSKGSGIPQVMAAIELANPKQNYKVDKLLSLRIIIVKIVSSCIMSIGGGIIGKEGPIVQIAGSVFRKINSWLPEWWPKISKRNMIMTGAAAGLAAAFNTPLGGIVFAVEELTKTHISYFKTALFTAVIIAGLTAQGLLGPYLYVGYPAINNPSASVFFCVILVAVLAGLCGSFTGKWMLMIVKWKSSFKKLSHHFIYVVCCALVIALAAFFLGDVVLNSGKELMTSTLFTAQKYSPWYFPIARMGGSILSFTTGTAGGVFAPALSAGASVGSAMAGWFHLSAVNSNVIILCGMVGFLTGITRTPFTSAILVLEMTDRHNVIFHLMLAGMIASMVSMIVDKHSLYDHLKVQYIHDINKEEEETLQQKQLAEAV
ncbi:MAG TPA: chloride channel protein [Parafilimonas sp.]|nr:chloride channel protein [Parafilimonas sp.]